MLVCGRIVKFMFGGRHRNLKNPENLKDIIVP